MESILSIIQCIAKTGHSYILLDESVENKKSNFPNPVAFTITQAFRKLYTTNWIPSCKPNVHHWSPITTSVYRQKIHNRILESYTRAASWCSSKCSIYVKQDPGTSWGKLHSSNQMPAYEQFVLHSRTILVEILFLFSPFLGPNCYNNSS